MLDYDSIDLFQNSHGFFYSVDTKKLQLRDDFSEETTRLFKHYYKMYDEYLFDSNGIINHNPTIPQKY